MDLLDNKSRNVDVTIWWRTRLYRAAAKARNWSGTPPQTTDYITVGLT